MSKNFGDLARTSDYKLMDEYFVQEFTDVARNHPRVAFSRMIEAIQTLDNNTRYMDCLDVSQTFFSSISRDLSHNLNIWQELNQTQLAKEIINGLIASTHCAQKLYAISDENAARSNISEGAKFIVGYGEEGISYAQSFVGLIRDLSNKSVLKIDNRSVTDFEYFYSQELTERFGG